MWTVLVTHVQLVLVAVMSTNSHQPTKPNALEQDGAVQRQGQALVA